MDQNRPATPVILWVVMFTALVAHLPALAGYFARSDWARLGYGAGLVAAEPGPRPLGDQLLWKSLWPVLGAEAAAYHGFALLLAIGVAALTVVVARALGAGPRAMTIAGLLTAASPALVRPIQWVSASPELLGAGLALGAVLTWRRHRPLPATVLTLLAVATADLAWTLPFALAAARRPADLRDRVALGLAGGGATLGLAAAVAAHGPPSLEGLRDWLAGATWFASPWPVLSPVLVVGASIWALWAVTARGSRSARVGFWLAVGSTGGLLLGPAEAGQGWALAAAGWGLALGALGGRLPFRPVPLLIAGALVLAAVGWTGTRSWLTARHPDGLHRDALVRDQAIAAESIRLLRQVPQTGTAGIAILQASRTPPPPDAPEDPDWVLPSPLHVALAGTLGPRVALATSMPVTWRSHLEGLTPDTVVFLDDGSVRLVPLGRLANARMVSALIAVAAQQYDRARHDLWSVVGGEGVQIRYHHDPDALPVTLDEIRAGAPGFVDHLRAQSGPLDRHLLQLFEQLYEAVTGEALFRSPWGDIQRG